MMMQLRRKTRQFISVSRRGFTMVELLITVLIASFVIIALYALLSLSSRNALVQEDVTNTLERVYFALDTVRDDLRLAGAAGMPSSAAPSDNYGAIVPCGYAGNASPTFSSLQRLDGNSNAANGLTRINASSSPENTAIGEQPDALRIVGPFRGQQSFRPQRFMVGTNFAQFDDVALTADGWNAERMAYAFDGAIVAVQNPAGGIQYVNANTTGSVGWGTPVQVTFANALAANPRFATGAALGDTCLFQGFGNERYLMTPLHAYEYRLIDDPADDTGTALVRNTLNSAGAEIDSIVLARNVVDFQIWFDRRAAGVVNSPQVSADGNFVDDNGTYPVSASPTDAYLARYAYIQITARLDNEIEGLTPPTGAPSTNGGLQTIVDVDDTSDGGARLITIRAEVSLEQFVWANL